MLQLFLKEEPVGNVYKKLISYACENNDTIMFEVTSYNTKVYDAYKYEEETEKEFKMFCKILNKTEQEMKENYQSKEFLNKAYTILKNEKNMGWEQRIKELLQEGTEIKNFDTIKEKIIRKNIESTIFLGAGKIIFQEKLNKLKEKLQEDLIKVDYQKEKLKSMILCDKYFYKISYRVKEVLLQEKSLYSMKFPNCLENITFLKSNYCWLKTISHENMCWIYPHSKNEIDYLTSIGLKFSINNNEDRESLNEH